MLKKTILAGMFFLCLGTVSTFAQFPAEGINYQAVARNAQGSVITAPISVRVSIYSSSPTGTLQYQETHNTTPSSLGLFNISIGQGTYVTGAVSNFSAINWGSATHFAKTEINTGSGFLDMGTSQLWAVPYALYAKNAGSGGGGASYTAGSGIGIVGNVISANDVSATNEIQSLSLSGSTLSISGANSVNLPTGTSYTAGSGISISGNVISATGGTGTPYTAGTGITISGNTISAVDASTTNEIQTISQSGNTITLSNGGGSVTTVDAQTLSLSGSNLSISGGNSVTLPTGTTYTAGTGITITGNTIAAVDASTTNEMQSLSISGNTLSISGGNSITLPSGGTGGGTLDQAYDFGGSGAGRTITADAGSVTINGSGTGPTNIGLVVNHSGTGSAAIGALLSAAATGNAINAVSSNPGNSFATIQATTVSSTQANSAVFGQTTGAARGVAGEVTASATADAAVRGNNLRTSGGIGVDGVGFNGVAGTSAYNQGFGVFGTNTSVANVSLGYYAVGIAGLSVNGVGVQGQTTNGQLPGVLGQNLNTGITYNNIGVYGQSTTGVGVYGDGTGYYGVLSNGDLGATGVKTFLIDHPLDPANKFLKHFSIESNEVLNIYRGTVALDANGEAVVSLPEYVEAVNKNYSYQLTSIGGYAPVYIKEKIANGKFKIAGGQAGMEISWQLVGERNDVYLVQNPDKREAEVEKTGDAKGKYLMPKLYGQSEDSQLINAPKKTNVSLKK